MQPTANAALLQNLGSRSVRVDPPETANLDYFYDFSSIFANPEQERLFTNAYNQYTNIDDPIENIMNEVNMENPYAQTETDSTNELLKILRGRA